MLLLLSLIMRIPAGSISEIHVVRNFDEADPAFGETTREKAATAAEIAQKVAEAEARAYQEGFAAGQREAKAESEKAAMAKGGGRKITAKGMKISADPNPANP